MIMRTWIRPLISLTACALLAGCGLEAPQTREVAGSAVQDDSAEQTEALSDSVVSESDPEAVRPAVTMVMAEVNPLDSIAGMTDLAFKEKVEELSDGSIQIDLQAEAVLGSEDAVLDKMLGGEGTIDLARISAFALTRYGGTKTALMSIPYTFENREHFWNFAESNLAEEMLMEPKEHGCRVRGLFMGEEGFRHFFMTSGVTEPADFQGKRIRVSNDPILEDLVQRLGAEPIWIPFDQIQEKFESGEIDGAEQPLVNYRSNGFQEVAPHLILDGHTLGVIEVIITDEAWEELSPQQQDVMMEAAEYASQYNRQISEEKELEMQKLLEEEGCTVTDVEDIAPWREACGEIAEIYSSYHKALYQEILDKK